MRTETGKATAGVTMAKTKNATLLQEHTTKNTPQRQVKFWGFNNDFGQKIGHRLF